MKLYNIHKSNQYDDLYYEGSSFIVGNKPNKFREEFLSRSCSYLDHIERKDDITIDHYHNLLDLLDFDLISKMNDEEMKKLVIFMKTFVSNSIIDFSFFNYAAATSPFCLSIAWFSSSCASAWETIPKPTRETSR